MDCSYFVVFFKYNDKEYFFSVKNANPFEFNGLKSRLEDKYGTHYHHPILTNNIFNTFKENFKPSSHLMHSWLSREESGALVLGFHRDYIREFDGSVDVRSCFIDYFSS